MSTVSAAPADTGIDGGLFHPGAAPLHIDGARSFNFLSIFDPASRDGWAGLLEAYTSAFTAADDVALILKPTSTSDISLEAAAAEITACLGAAGVDGEDGPLIILHWVEMPEEALPSLYRAADCVVAVTADGADAREITEAQACGVAAIAAARDDLPGLRSQLRHAWLDPAGTATRGAVAAREVREAGLVRERPVTGPRDHLGVVDPERAHAGIVLLNYNLPAETDALVARLAEVVRYPTKLIVFDNASDQRPHASFTNATALQNSRTGGGNLIGAHLLANRFPEVEYFFFLHNDMRFESDACPITPLVAALQSRDDAAAVHPAILSGVALGDRELAPQDPPSVRPAPRNGRGRIIIDDICPVLVRKSDYYSVGGFDPRLTRCYGAGLDLYNRLAERGRELLICDEVKVFHQGQYTYANGVGDESHASCDELAQREMDAVFIEKYGPDWRIQFARDAPVA